MAAARAGLDSATAAMNNPGLNADLTVFARVDTAAMEWQKSPSAGVWRKRVFLDGPAEAGRVTSVVRYDPGSAFAAHDHPDGEEILVLEGIFSDESGDYGPGHYVLNPEGFRHAPRTGPGCTLFVKLRQYPSAAHVHHHTRAMDWQATGVDGVAYKPLHADQERGIGVNLIRIDAGAEAFPHDHPGGEELFVLSGDAFDENGAYGAGTWLRYPPGSRHAITSRYGCTLYVQNGGFGGPQT